jgi:tetratricopeptide (TPR) repeat protein
MKRIWMFAFIGVLGLASVSCAKLQARDNLQKGARAFRDAHYETAINYFQEAIKLDPSLTSAELYLATAYAQQFIPGAQSEENMKNAQMAIKTFESVLTHDPNNTTAIANLGGLYYQLNQPAKAREYYMKDAELEPSRAEPFYSVATVDWAIVANKAAPPPMDEQVRLVEEGLQYVDKALAINQDYDDAMTYKNLLLRLKAGLETNQEEKKKLEAQADELFNLALATRKKNQEKKKSPGGIVIEK